MTYDLQVLATNRDALLLAEVAAWLHDDFKHTEGHILQYVTGAPSPSGRQDTQDLVPTRQVTLLGKTLSFDFVKNRKKDDFCNGYLNRCHYTAHIEKQDGDGPQSYPAYVSSPFGYEGYTMPGHLTNDLRSRISWHRLSVTPFTYTERSELQEEIAVLFSRVGGDTRRPANEITLWEWGHTVGALYKAALAGALLGYKPEPDGLKWRLLSVRVDSEALLDNATRLPDLLERQQILANAFARVRTLLEATYPLGTEVYRDENSSVYVVPNVENLDKLCDEKGQTLRALILAEFAQGTVRRNPQLALAGEIIPHVELDAEAWWGQSPDRDPKKDEIPPIGKILSKKVTTQADSQGVAKWWNGKSADVCPACGLRPQGPGKKAKERKVCDVCEERRDDRAKDWAKPENLNTTIWTDEVADVNGYLALIVGQFNLNEWLNGTMVQTLAVTEPQNGQAILKNPSFARLRRVLETTRAFWQDIGSQVFPGLLSDDRRRLQIWFDQEPDLNDFQVNELDLGTTTLSVMWCKDGNRGYLISTDNLGYTARQLGAEKDIYTHSAAAAIFVEDYIRERFVNGRQEPVLRNPEASAAERRRNLLEGSRIDKTNHEDATYITAISILAEPRTFMALVPADRALDVVKEIKAKYEREMSKVRNRLPLTLGIVYFGRRTPLAAALETGRKMLKVQASNGKWQVMKNDTDGQQRKVTLQKDGREITVAVNTVMGDGTTPDVWYPYWRVTSKPTDRTRWFVGPDGEHWVHVNELRTGDEVAFTPSTFDFEYLDTTARRFEVSYANGQRRGDDKRQRPYLLEELKQIEQAWGEIRKLPTSQIKGLETVIEAKRRDWLTQDSPPEAHTTFARFVHDALKKAKGDSSAALERAAISGMLTDALELHLTINKDKTEQEDN